MRILYVANRKGIFSGGQISLLELLKGLDTEQFEPVVLCPGEGPMAEKIRTLGITVKLWDMPSAKSLNILRTHKKIEELTALMKDLSVDIVHTNGSRAQFYAASAIKGRRVCLLWHVREAKKDNFFYDRFLGKAADKIICVSNGVAKDRFGRYPIFRKKIQVIHNGVDVHNFTRDEEGRDLVRAEFDIGSGDLLLGIVGLLCSRKGHIFLFKAIEWLSDKFPNLRTLVVGEAIDAEYYLKLKKIVNDLNLKNKVIFAGSRKDIKDVLSALDIFVLPSQSEGFSRVLLEAMACKCPIITTDVEGNNEAIVNGKSGVLVPFGDVAALVKSIEEVISDPDKTRKLAEEAKNRVEECFSIGINVGAIESIYKEVGGGSYYSHRY